MKKVRLAIAGFAAFAMGIVGTAAQSINAVTAEELEAALAEAGLSPTIIEDASTGTPVAQGAAGQFKFYVRALNCSGEPLACEDLIFFANFGLQRSATAADFRIVNDFNDSQVFGRAYVLEERDEVGVDYVIELGGGVSQDHLSQNIGRWADVISAFVEEFIAGSETS